MAVIFERSHSTDRALAAEVRPRLRGWLHRVAAVVAVPAAIALVLAAPTTRSRVAVGVFGASIVTMFVISALVHARPWRPHTLEVLFRLDHTGIYLAIAGTATPIGVLALQGWHAAAVVWGVWIGAGIGIVLEWLPFRTPRGVAHALYLVLGWATVPFVPAIIATQGWDAAVLLLAGGLVYTIGATIVALQRPDPAPHVFGYHEVWHAMVVVAVGLHFVMVGGLLPPAAGA